MSIKSRVFRISVATHDLPSFLEECEASEWYAYDTGERVMTEEGPDAEAVLLIEPTPRATTRKAEVLAQ